MSETDDPRIHAPATARNRDPILAVLRRVLPESGLVLEVASGSGEHAVHFAAALPGLTFQPSDPEPDRRASIDAWTASSGLSNIRPALALDAEAEIWPCQAADAVLCFNMIHIAPWSAAIGLLRGAGCVLGQGGKLVLYGPFRRDGAHTAPSNEAFDADLRRRNPAWGVRELETIAAAAAQAGFAAPSVEAMPANNFCVIFERRPGG
jgi:hypothetical protein